MAIKVIKVAARKNERTTAKKPANTGKVWEVADRLVTKEKGKERLGDQGKMTLSDFEAKNFAPYGLTERDIYYGKEEAATVAGQQINELAAQNADLAAQLAEMKTKMAELTAGEDTQRFVDGNSQAATANDEKGKVAEPAQTPAQPTKKGGNNK